jgi:signal transduction histidine kinase/CheY-like chemotaxis protein
LPVHSAYACVIVALNTLHISVITDDFMVTLFKRKISLPVVLVVPFVVQLLGVVGIVGYLSLRNGQLAVENLATHLMHEVCQRTEQKLRQYFAQPFLVNQINAHMIESGQVDLQDLDALSAITFDRLMEFEGVSGVLIGTAEGNLRSATRRQQLRLIDANAQEPGKLYDYAASDDGQRQNLLRVVQKPDIRKSPWYRAGLTAQQPIWSPIFQTGDNQELSLNANLPLIDAQTGEVMGVASAGLVLSVIDNFLDSFQISPNGVVFVIDRQGLLLGASSKESVYHRLESAGKVQLKQVPATESANGLIRASAQYVAAHFTGQVVKHPQTIMDFYPQGERIFLEVAPFRDAHGLDWLIVVAVPERDFMAQIQKNTRNTIALCLGATGIAIVLGWLTARWIARPILQLSRASEKIADGDFRQTLPPADIDEVNILVNSFNRMSQQIQEYSTMLEAKVRQRTLALEQEIFERKQIEERLEHSKTLAESANRSKSKFLANMSHELRTPLNAILGFTQLMSYKGQVDTEHQEYLNIINQSGQHLLSLINNVLDLSKIEANQMELNLSGVDLHALLNNLENLFSLKAEAQRLVLNMHIAPEVPRLIYSDGNKLRQILTNLLSNAIKFTDHGHIGLSVRLLKVSPEERSKLWIEDSGHSISGHSITTASNILLFTITDTGNGIAAQDLERIFAPFVQASEGQFALEGTGLGLAISQQYAHLLGGHLSVESQVGQGSCFRLTLPAFDMVAVEEEPLSWEQNLDSIAMQDMVFRILIAEDQAENQYLLQQLLSLENLEVRYVDNGQSALEVWRSWQPHLILMDLAMPLLDGYEATRQIKATSQGQATAIIAVTSYAFEENRQAALRAGCDDFVRKPIQLSELLPKISHYLRLQRAQTCPESTQRSVEPLDQPPSLHEGHRSMNHLSQTWAESLATMPTSWLQQLREVAYHCSDQQVLRLLQAIPSSETALRQYLTILSEAFRFDEIVQLVERALAHVLEMTNDSHSDSRK